MKQVELPKIKASGERLSTNFNIRATFEGSEMGTERKNNEHIVRSQGKGSIESPPNETNLVYTSHNSTEKMFAL